MSSDATIPHDAAHGGGHTTHHYPYVKIWGLLLVLLALSILGPMLGHPIVTLLTAFGIAFVKAFMDAGKPVASICHGPWILIEAGAVAGRTLTSTARIATDLRNAGANWVDIEVVVDGNLLTSRSPRDLPAFNAALVEAVARG